MEKLNRAPAGCACPPDKPSFTINAIQQLELWNVRKLVAQYIPQTGEFRRFLSGDSRPLWVSPGG
jgi:hypothetical protein